MEKWQDGENRVAYLVKNSIVWPIWYAASTRRTPATTTNNPLYQISFGVAPALLAFTVGLRTYLDTVVLTCFICCGLARLARFNATVALVPKDASGKAKFFEGLPIPSSLVLVGMLSVWTKMGWIEGQAGIPLGTITLWGPESGTGEIHLVSVVFGCWAAAMVSKTLRVPKLWRTC